jgi:hypothetical protein
MMIVISDYWCTAAVACLLIKLHECVHGSVWGDGSGGIFKTSVENAATSASAFDLSITNITYAASTTENVSTLTTSPQLVLLLPCSGGGWRYLTAPSGGIPSLNVGTIPTGPIHLDGRRRLPISLNMHRRNAESKIFIF